ncbi:DUF3558 domain-containing protein [Saccharopolyspora sp. ASAGF58]|uniref:DUF3558 domain-containing protein n=1 Tax=Saccharopolyspora sp. ASAGF58 TaxID=2719023 RepID=UPI0014400714|nr:DUF3558 domain-containing protein [Saccharopolyspora sp. ASAGF58]QIZ34296.1 DUF3558 domain-containing protein [Saccharopolyspora sp. ASAGF58]
MTVHTTRTTFAAATSLLVLGLAACTAPGTPEPAPSSETNSAANDPFHIEQPKNLAAVSEPCQLLTSAQAQQLGAGSPEPDSSEWGQGACKWRNQQFSTKVAPDTAQGQGLRWAAKIDGDDQGNPNVRVNGYPAVHGGISGIRCSTTVGVSDTQALMVHFTTGSEGRGNPEYTDPCAMSDKIAGMVLENIPPA